MKVKNRLGFFASSRARALNYERELRYAKIKECLELKDENDKLWDMAVKQRVALDTMQKSYMAEIDKLLAALKSSTEKVAAAEAERDRYREALRRAFPKEAAV